MGGGQSAQEKSNVASQKDQQDQANKNLGAASSTLAGYTGPLTASPIYSSLLRSGTQSTNDAYDAASSNLRASMMNAGVSGASGAGAGTSAAIGAARAGALGKVQPAAIEGASQAQLEATRQLGGIGATQTGAAGKYADLATQQDLYRQQQQGGLFGAMLQTGLNIGEKALESAPFFA